MSVSCMHCLQVVQGLSMFVRLPSPNEVGVLLNKRRYIICFWVGVVNGMWRLLKVSVKSSKAYCRPIFICSCSGVANVLAMALYISFVVCLLIRSLCCFSVIRESL